MMYLNDVLSVAVNQTVTYFCVFLLYFHHAMVDNRLCAVTDSLLHFVGYFKKIN